jgi:hypothetical protein
VVDDQGGSKKGNGSGRSHYELLSNYMPVPLEAFTVVIYTNNYKKFMNLHWKCDGGELSSVSTVSGPEDTLFTNDSRGAGKYGGWSEDGMEFYNRVFEVIERQRTRSFRKGFEEKVRKLIQKANQGGGKRIRSGIAVRNSIATLDRLVATSSR